MNREEKVKEAKNILRKVGLPEAQQNEISALTLLALCRIGPKDPWRKARRESLTITKGIMDFIKRVYEKEYAPNTRETFRRQVLHQFAQAKIVDLNPDNPKLPTNSPKTHYALTEDALKVIQKYGTPEWEKACRHFVDQHGKLIEVYRKRRQRQLVPVKFPDGSTFNLSPGEHNKLQAAVVEEFAPRFAPGARVLYLGDAAKKNLFVDKKSLADLGIEINTHDKLPDVVLYDEKRDWIFLIEAVTSHGPMTPKRIVELQEKFSSCTANIIFVIAFPDFSEFRKHIQNIAWETEVWIKAIPDHLIHYNGDKFLYPR